MGMRASLSTAATVSMQRLKSGALMASKLARVRVRDKSTSGWMLSTYGKDEHGE
jgi:hypothetical protein